MRAYPLVPALAALCASCDREILVGEDPAHDASLVTVSEASEANEPAEATETGDASLADAPAVDAQDLDVASGAGDDSGLPPLVVPWSTGFENSPGDSWVPGNPAACYVSGGASFQIVTSPVHSGQHSASFSVNTAIASPSQTRCLKQGVLPPAAYYGAWYYVPSSETNSGNWNLYHFQGADVADGTTAHGLWDVSLANAADGSLHAVVWDFLRMRLLQTSATIPVGTWVHLEVFLRRASNSTGQFTLRVGGQVALDLTGLVTDDSRWGQWLVGNYGTALAPSASTVYVDDVAIGLVSSP